ncbi:AraC family transcriptional regulator [Granulicella sp. L60]|uniref:AraC family transcriptional regulator n=1 Tax=Granulicella sp. L60 TaxID=1641866 RepID=UPI00131B014D|nr:AraC family transcriptional regulator [Granulicella sp. L60]
MAEIQGRLKANLEKAKDLLLGLTTADGVQPSKLDDVQLIRALSGSTRSLALYEPSIYILASGRKKVFRGDDQFVCHANQYLVFAALTSLEMMTESSDDGEPVLGLSVRVGLPTLLELMHKLGMQGAKVNQSDNILPTALDLEMSEAILRLLGCLASEADAAILGPGVVRELIYRVLIGPRGGELRSMLNRTNQSGKIFAALEWIHRNYQRPLTIPEIANEVCMSVSAFHHSFKEITGSSPLQYIKSVKLQRARLHIKYDRLGAWMAAAKVGYESPSQFSRDFKRYFGYTPTEEETGGEPKVEFGAPAASHSILFVPEIKPLPAIPEQPDLQVNDEASNKDDPLCEEQLVRLIPAIKSDQVRQPFSRFGDEGSFVTIGPHKAVAKH